METGAKILIFGGTLSLAVAFLLGFVMARARTASPEVAQPLLLQSHRVALWEGFMLLGLSLAVRLSTLSSGTETLAASLLVAATTLSIGSTLTNWLKRDTNMFASRSLGLGLAVVNSIVASVGLAILVVGVFKGL